MSVKTIVRTAKDNKYLHRDFHISCDVGINYIGERYGLEGAQAYICQYVDSYLSLLTESVRKRGLEALAQYFREIYEAEEAGEQLEMTLHDNSLDVRILACPGISHMKASKHTPSVWYRQTTDTLYQRLAENAGLTFILDNYSEDNGAASFRFEKEALV